MVCPEALTCRGLRLAKRHHQALPSGRERAPQVPPQLAQFSSKVFAYTRANSYAHAYSYPYTCACACVYACVSALKSSTWISLVDGFNLFISTSERSFSSAAAGIFQ
jgi:hypothetical protein